MAEEIIVNNARLIDRLIKGLCCHENSIRKVQQILSFERSNAYRSNKFKLIYNDTYKERGGSDR